MSTTSVTPDPWAVVSHTPVQQTQTNDPWAVVSHQPLSIPGQPKAGTPSSYKIPGMPDKPFSFPLKVVHAFGIPTSQAEIEQAQKEEEAKPLYERFLPGHQYGGKPMSATETIGTALAGPAAPLFRALGSGIGQMPELAKKSVEERKQIIPAVKRGDIKGALAHTAGTAGYAANTILAPVLGSGPAQAGEAFGRGDTEEGLAQTIVTTAPFVAGDVAKPFTAGLEEMKAGLTPPPEVMGARAATRPTHVEALTGLISDEGGRVNPFETATTALPEARATAIKAGIDPSTFKGRAGGEAVVGKNGVFNQAIREHRAQFAEIKKPFATAQVDATPIGQAYLDAITPEMRANEPQVANRLTAEARKYVDVGDNSEINGAKPMTLDDMDAFRTRLNRELNAFESKSTGEKIMSDVELRAHKAAADAARNTLYDTLDRLSGNKPGTVRTLKAKEGALIEAKNSLEKEFNRASGAQGEAVTKGLREKIASTYPSPRGVKHAAIREVIGPKPLDVFNQRLQKMFGDLPKEPEPQIQQPVPPVSTEQRATVRTSDQQRSYSQALQQLRDQLREAQDANDTESITSLQRMIQQTQTLAQQNAKGMRGIAGITQPTPTSAASTPTKLTPPYTASSNLTRAQKATAWMLAAKSGSITPEEADRQAHRQVGRGTKIRRPVGGEE